MFSDYIPYLSNDGLLKLVIETLRDGDERLTFGPRMTGPIAGFNTATGQFLEERGAPIVPFKATPFVAVEQDFAPRRPVLIHSIEAKTMTLNFYELADPKRLASRFSRDDVIYPYAASVPNAQVLIDHQVGDVIYVVNPMTYEPEPVKLTEDNLDRQRMIQFRFGTLPKR